MTTERNNENRRGKEDNKRNRKWPYILVILLLLLLRSCGNQHPWPVPAAVQFRISTITISIHAPLTGNDYHFSAFDLEFTYFNPRSPHGERQQKLIKSESYYELFAQICSILYA